MYLYTLININSAPCRKEAELQVVFFNTVKICAYSTVAGNKKTCFVFGFFSYALKMSLCCYVNRSFKVRDRNGRTESGNTGGIKGEGKNKKVNLVKAKTNPDSTCPQGEDPSPRSTDTRDTSYHDTCDLMGGWMIT